MTTKDKDKLAKGPNPRDRIAVPKHGTRCPRCHVRAPKGERCDLCDPVS